MKKWISVLQAPAPGKYKSKMISGLKAATILSFPLISPAWAQEQPVGPEARDAPLTEVSDITVTGSRIVRDGFSAPVPVTVLGQEEIAAQVPANITEFVNQLPAVTQGFNSFNTSGLVSSGNAGLNSINLRGLGAGRTLVLIDGQRSVASNAGGIVDINTVPQDLVERVEVVTGGASAAYGSDAVGGVINFILNTGFKGFKISADQGISTYGDGRNYRISGSAGFSLLDDRLHILLNGSFNRQEGIDSIDRDWNDKGYFQINNPAYTASNGEPRRLVGAGVGPATYTVGGLVSSGPLQGLYFLENGVTGQLNYGTTNIVSSPWMIGGDTDVTLAGHGGTNPLIPDEKRYSLFNRTSFDISDSLQFYAQLSWNRYEGRANYQQTPSTNVSISRDNAYLNLLYPDVAAELDARGLDSITIGTSNAGFPIPGSQSRREIQRYVAGLKGRFPLFGRDWRWDAYYQHGIAKTHIEATNSWNTARLSLAQDAIVSGGQIICRSTLSNPDNGCVPINRLGVSGPSDEALAYIYGAQNPYRDDVLKQDVGAVTLSGELFTLPGGPAAIAFGGEWRREKISGFVEPEFNRGWLYGNFVATHGSYTVKEGFVEIDLPVLPGVNLNAAGRFTDYSTSGSVQTWKLGGSYAPVEDIRFRGTYSRDIRAPNLQELFAAGSRQTNTVILPSNAPQSGSRQFTENTIGNLNLRPETAKTWTAGVVLTPQFLPGFSASFDYYDIRVSDAIGSVTAQNTVDFCYDGTAPAFCNNISYVNGVLDGIILQPFNYASQKARGYDIALGYRTPLSAIAASLPGNFSINASVTHYIANIVDNLVFPVDYAGVNSGGTYAQPSWVYRISAFYELDPVSLNLVVRGFGSGVYGNNYIECVSGCPASTTQYLTINDNHIPGATYVDTSISSKFRAGSLDGKLTLVVNNLLNKDPVSVGNGPTGNHIPAYPQTNRNLYDTIGRSFRIAASISF